VVRWCFGVYFVVLLRVLSGWFVGLVSLGCWVIVFWGCWLGFCFLGKGLGC